MNQIYGFEGEVKAKYTAQMYELFSEVFEWLPLAQCINGKVLVSTAAGSPRPSPLPSRRATWADRCAAKKSKGWGLGYVWCLPSHSCPPLNPRSCTGACSVRTASPWMTSGRSNGIGSLQTQVTGLAG